MNPLQTLFKIPGLLKENVDDVLQRAESIEGKIKTLPAQIDAYEVQANEAIDNLIKKIAESNPFKTIQNLLEDSAIYHKLKNQNITGLFEIPDGFNEEDPEQLEAFMTQKAKWLKSFLEPLKLEKIDNILNLINEIASDVMQIPDSLNLNDSGIVNAYRSMKLDQIRPKLIQLVELIIGQPVHDQVRTSQKQQNNEINEHSDTIESFLDKIENAMPEVEQHLSSLDKSEMNIEAYIQAIKNILPLISPFSSSAINKLINKIEPDLKDIENQVKSLDYSKTDQLVNGIVNILAELSNKHIKSGSPFYPLNEIIQKIKLIVNYLVEKGLLVPVKIHLLAKNDVLPKTHSIHIPASFDSSVKQNSNVATKLTTQHIKSSSVALKDPEPTIKKAVTLKNTAEKGENDSSSTNTEQANRSTQRQNGINVNTRKQSENETIMQENEFLLEKLIKEGLASLEKQNNSPAKALTDFANFFNDKHTPLKDFTNEINVAFQQSWRTIINAIENKQANTLSKIIDTLISQFSKILNITLNHLEEIIKQLIKLLTASLKFIIGLILGIKIPDDYLAGIIPDGKKVKNINLFFLIIALPIEVLIKISGLSVSPRDTG